MKDKMEKEINPYSRENNIKHLMGNVETLQDNVWNMKTFKIMQKMKKIKRIKEKQK
jgi:hypothetical protein